MRLLSIKSALSRALCLCIVFVMVQAISPSFAAVFAQDKAIAKTIRFGKGRTSAIVKDAVKKGTSHEYKLRARGDQQMIVHLATGRRTSFTIYGPGGVGIVEGADGVKDWTSFLPETGEYIITIGTDVTAKYTLEVTIR